VLAGLVIAVGIYTVGFAGAGDSAPDQDVARGRTTAAETASSTIGGVGMPDGDFMSAMHQAMSRMSPEDIEAMHEAMAEMSDKQIAAMHRAMMKMTPEQMARVCQAHLRAAQVGNKSAK
ncbi:MAG TPA: hypothetical protein VIK75_04765, partial [Calditerricola sp.]